VTCRCEHSCGGACTTEHGHHFWRNGDEHVVWAEADGCHTINLSAFDRLFGGMDGVQAEDVPVVSETVPDPHAEDAA
jgi:hypothetical protein